MVKRLLKDYYGDLPLHTKGPNTGRIDREKTAKIYCITIEELFKAYWNWQEVFRINGSTLTFQQYLNKQKEAGISPFDVGNGIGQYNLSRYFDEGSYTLDNCRFITREENLAEQKH